MLLKFESLAQPVQLAQGLKILPYLMRAFAGWPFREMPKSRAREVLLNVLRDGDGFVMEAPWLEERQEYRNSLDLVQGLAGHMARCWFSEHRGLLWLEASAAAFGDQIVVFVGGPRSGKSLLMACLAAGGNKVFADGILAASAKDQYGMSLGMAPRLKLPLAEELGAPLRGTVDGLVDRCNEETGYLSARGGGLARFGESARIRAFVLLDRSATVPAALSSESGGKILKRLLLNSFGEGMGAGDLLTDVKRLVTGVPCYRLAWSDPQEATAALRARFAAWRTPMLEALGQDIAQPRRQPRRRSTGPSEPSGRLFSHRKGLTEHLVDSDLFIVGPQGETIYHLNGLGAGLWRLMDGSHGLGDVVSVLRDAYPGVDSMVIENDVAALVRDLSERGLLIEKVC